ncbi:alpha/beta hydrolase [Dyadobacter sp. CY107]|uniref:alpha/beta fold hydrolase n=1 Tax=Dyadobacter fanqingshengii TaxID=2906443 RepID=UPI001F19EEDB|nr:alpha/beta hydrolase [Dyadobacter fanqingshengii]MCF2503999.1 alpha/beta hydrolase [Dyadobacter fanqingshengii]
MAHHITLHYQKLGHGPKTLLAFHGIGQDGVSCFQPFEAHLSEHYTIYAFDLFFHGKSNFLPDELVTKELWRSIILDFLAQNHIEKFDVAGFSMGGRFALATLELFADSIENAFLIAPDGVSEHPLYGFATRFWLTRRLFQWSMQKPEPFFIVANALKQAGLIHSSLHRFVQQVLNTPDKRQTIYDSWVNFRNLRFDIPALHRLALASNIKIYLFVGEFDTLLKPVSVRKLASLLPAHQYITLKSGHTKLVEHAASWICALFK